ncbi:MAG: hypothetical protein K5829_06125 [Treponema sp.]|nr:hypothetical protein [Treponema sp.]
MLKKRLFYSLVFLFLFQSAAFSGILERPRTLNYISTAHFDIFFTKNSIESAALIADCAETYYESALSVFPLDYQLRIVIVISPDSETLDIKYTPIPYNRIIVYESLPQTSDFSAKDGYKARFESLLEREIFRAIGACSKDSFWQFASKLLLGDSLQPVAAVNMPEEFFNGCSAAAQKQADGSLSSSENFFDDSQNLSILVQAKLEGHFPSLFQLYGGMDIYPQEKLSSAALSAFSAFIMQKYGFPKFYEFWQACGKIHFFKLHSGIFKSIYGFSLEEEWEAFYDAIPLPQVKEISCQSLTAMNESVCKYLSSSKYGLVWYDELKKEVDLYNPDGTIKIRQLLFLADSVNNISVSPCGRFISVSYTQTNNREAFTKEITMLYDLEYRTFLRTKYNLRDAAILELEKEKYALVGLSVKEKLPELMLYSADEINFLIQNPHEIKPKSFKNTLLYSRKFSSNTIPFSPVYAGENAFFFLLRQILPDSKNGNTYIGKIDFSSGQESYWQLFQNEKLLNIGRLYFNRDPSSLSAENLYFFDYVFENADYGSDKSDRVNYEPNFTRTGALIMNQVFEPCEVYLQKEDYSGGVGPALAKNDTIYFISHKFERDYAYFSNISEIDFEAGRLMIPNVLFPDWTYKKSPEVEAFPEDESGNIRRLLNQNEIKNYNFINYFLKGGWNIFNPVKDFSLERGVEKSPGLGVSFETSSDVLSENKMILCAGLVFLPLDFTKIFNPTQKSLEELENYRTEYYKNFTFSAYLENTSTPVDLSLGSIFKFNIDGQYDFKVIGGASYLLPMRMNFRKLTMSLKGMFTASTTFWDAHQQELYPNLDGWTSLQDSYRSLQGLLYLNYTNIHQYGISAFKKLGLQFDTLIASVWDINLFELQREKGVKVARAQSLNEAIKNQMWGTYAPTQINMGVAATLEIPHLLPIANAKNWVLSFPSTIHAELFYTNGNALDVYAKTLIAGKEIQNGWEASKIYVQRIGLYFGYEAAFEYDTNSVVLPDLRDFTRFYTVFSNTVLNDSIFADLVFHLTPVIGDFANVKAELNLKSTYYLSTKEFKVSLGLKFN